jgi:hypothetical protein
MREASIIFTPAVEQPDQVEMQRLRAMKEWQPKHRNVPQQLR